MDLAVFAGCCLDRQGANCHAAITGLCCHFVSLNSLPAKALQHYSSGNQARGIIVRGIVDFLPRGQYAPRIFWGNDYQLT